MQKSFLCLIVVASLTGCSNSKGKSSSTPAAPESATLEFAGAVNKSLVYGEEDSIVCFEEDGEYILGIGRKGEVKDGFLASVPVDQSGQGSFEKTRENSGKLSVFPFVADSENDLWTARSCSIAYQSSGRHMNFQVDCSEIDHLDTTTKKNVRLV